MKNMPAHILEALGPGVTFADADQYFCAARRAPTHPLEPLQFKPVHKAPWLMQAWKYDICERRDEPDFRMCVTVDRKGDVIFGKWEMVDEYDDHEMSWR
jgi:hypothetical protein